MMNPIQQLFSDLQGIEALPAEVYATAKVNTETHILDAAALQTALAACQQVSGWVQGPSHVSELNQTALPSDSVILDGEWQQANHHYSLTHLGLGQWQLTTTELQACDAAQANCVAETVYQNRVGKGQSQLVYKKLWQFTGPEHAQAPTVTQAVFAGFKGE